MNYQGNENKNKKDDILDKNKDLIIDSNKGFNYPSLDKDNMNEGENINNLEKYKDLIVESNTNFIYQGKKHKDNTKDNDMKNFNQEDFIIESNQNINYEGIKEPENVYNIKNNLTKYKNNKNVKDSYLEKPPQLSKNLCYISKIRKKPLINDIRNKNLNINDEKDNKAINKSEDSYYLEKPPHMAKNICFITKKRKKLSINEMKNKNLNKYDDKNNKPIKKSEDYSYFLEKPPQLSKNLYFITKIRKKPSINDNNNKNLNKFEDQYKNISKYPKENDKIKEKDRDIINYQKPKIENGLFISKLRLKNNLGEIKKIQDEIKNYLLKNKENEKIYKKPLFNQFFYFIDENPSEKKLLKNKNKSNEENNPEKNKNKNNKNNEDNNYKEFENKENKENKDDNDDNNNINKNKNIDNNNDQENYDSGPKYVERIIPKKKESEIFRLKPNHLLKIIKIQKGKKILEKLIQSGKVVPNKPIPEDENIQNEYKSKTPEKINRNIKFDEDDNNIDKNKNPNKKKDINDNNDDKNLLFQSPLGYNVDDNDEMNNNVDEGNMTDYEDNILKNKRIKKYKNNMGNYFYMSKIRKGDIDETPIKTIQNQIRAKNSKDLEKYNYIDKKNNENEIIQNIMKNICFYDKIIIKNEPYKQYLNKFDKITKHKNNIYKIPKNFKENKNDNKNAINYNNNADFITKLRHIEIKNKNKKNNDEENKQNIINKNCYITKERKMNCLSLPNNLYKKNPYIITKDRKINNNNNINNNNLLSRKNYNFKNINNPNNNICFITKKRKLKEKKGIILPLPKIKYITKERKKILDRYILLPKKEISFINKIRKRENINQIKTIQNIFKSKNNKNKEVNKNKPFYNNEDKNAFIPRKKCYFREIDDSDFDNEEIEKDNYYLNGYISKEYRRNIYKNPIQDICYISKQYMINNNNYEKIKIIHF